MGNKEKLQLLNAAMDNYLMKTLNITFSALGDDYLIAKMPVNERVYQPDRVLHGGATFALAETVGSVAAHIFSKGEKQMVRGIEMSGNHIRSVQEGHIFARAQAVHKGRTTQIWEIKITDDKDRMVSLIKLTTITLPKEK